MSWGKGKGKGVISYGGREFSIKTHNNYSHMLNFARAAQQAGVKPREVTMRRHITIKLVVNLREDESFNAIINSLKEDAKNILSMASMMGDAAPEIEMKAETFRGRYKVNVHDDNDFDVETYVDPDDREDEVDGG